MKEKWITYKLKEITTRIGDGLHGTPEYDNNGDYFFINGSNLVNGNIEMNYNTKRVSYKEFAKYGKELSDRTILLGINGTIGNIALYKNEKCILGKSAAYINIKDDFDKIFIKYVLTNQHFQNYIKINATGTTIKNIGLGLLRQYEFMAPEELATQRQISQIPSSLDDKIEINQQMNQTLEAIAQAIFKEWFVNFHFPGFDGQLVDGLPKGWKIGKLSDSFNLIMGQSPPGESYNEIGEGEIFYQGRTDFKFRFPENRMYTTAPTRRAKKLDTLVSVRAPVGDVNMAIEDCCIGRGLSSVRHKTGAYSFTYYSMKNLENVFHGFESEGTVFGSINKANFENIETIIPADNIVLDYEFIVNSIDEKIHNNSLEINSLTATRDSLLPKLMSGKIEVKA